ncbi:hypothetical protein G6661_01785 [Polynucleobacter paneuropaeus]|nr:hypothetical protein G6661_01785 [Polynucleobacter paneuropaeus]
MRLYKLKDMFRGWFIGNFDPSVHKTELFEVGVLQHKKGEHWPGHVHRLSEEFNVLLEGYMTINELDIHAGDIFVIEKNEYSQAIFHEDCKIVCVKIPSIPSDKHFN